MTEREAAIDWLENLTARQRRELFAPAAVCMIGYDEEDRVGFVATLKNDHEGDLAYCPHCKDPNAIVVA